jgi:hypothetical protein
MYRKFDVTSNLFSHSIFLELNTAVVADHGTPIRPLFRLGKNFNPMNSTTFVLFDKYYPIVDQLGSKDSSRDLQLNCVIS